MTIMWLSHSNECFSFSPLFQQNGDENSIINWIYDGDRLKMGDDDNEPMSVEDVRRKMEMFHLNRWESDLHL